LLLRFFASSRERSQSTRQNHTERTTNPATNQPNRVAVAAAAAAAAVVFCFLFVVVVVVVVVVFVVWCRCLLFGVVVWCRCLLSLSLSSLLLFGC